MEILKGTPTPQIYRFLRGVTGEPKDSVWEDWGILREHEGRLGESPTPWTESYYQCHVSLQEMAGLIRGLLRDNDGAQTDFLKMAFQTLPHRDSSHFFEQIPDSYFFFWGGGFGFGLESFHVRNRK